MAVSTIWPAISSIVSSRVSISWFNRAISE
jgi:hypothetical protein